MESFKAREIGCLVNEVTRSGEVASVYAGAVNILVPEKVLLSLVERPSQMSALGIRVPELFESGRSGSGKRPDRIERGTKVTHRGKDILLGDLTIEPARANVWSGAGFDYPGLAAGFAAGKIELFKRALLSRGKEGGLIGLYQNRGRDNPFVQRAQRILAQVKMEKIEGEPPRLQGLSGLLGLGIGLTPSGDDFLAGVLLGERMLTASRTVDKEEIGKALDRTGFPGRTLIWQALKEHFPHYLIEAARGLAGADSPEEMIAVVERATSHGETSGTDALTGLLWYLEKV